MSTITRDKDINVLDFESKGKFAMTQNDHLKVRIPDLKAAEHLKNVFILTSVGQLAETSPFVRVVRANLRALLIHDEYESSTWFLHALKQAKIRQSRNMVVHTDPQVPRRILNAWQCGGQAELIADATVRADHLLVTTCALELLAIPFDAIAALKTIPIDRRRDFVIESDGSSINWPEFDIDLELEGMRMAINPELRARAEHDRMMHDIKFGDAIASLRKSSKLRQSDIEGLSDRQVRRIEAGQSSATGDAIEHLARAHGLSPNKYMDKIANLISDNERHSNIKATLRELEYA